VSVAEAAHRPAKTGRSVALWLGFLILIAAGIGLAWAGAGALRPEVTPSGLQFRTIKSGHGAKIGPDDAALMDYVLSADDGKVFDSSETHGGPQPFAMAQVFPGFAEAMTRMQDGGQYRFTMPQRLAFTTGTPPPGWPKDSALTFDVAVRKVVPGGAAMMGGPPQPPQQSELPPGMEQPRP
jgi:FKBP-type peptidyl-prolyl cis-trans isomerase FkpA